MNANDFKRSLIINLCFWNPKVVMVKSKMFQIDLVIKLSLCSSEFMYCIVLYFNCTVVCSDFECKVY